MRSGVHIDPHLRAFIVPDLHRLCHLAAHRFLAGVTQVVVSLEQSEREVKLFVLVNHGLTAWSGVTLDDVLVIGAPRQLPIKHAGLCHAGVTGFNPQQTRAPKKTLEGAMRAARKRIDVTLCSQRNHSLNLLCTTVCLDNLRHQVERRSVLLECCHRQAQRQQHRRHQTQHYLDH